MPEEGIYKVLIGLTDPEVVEDLLNYLRKKHVSSLVEMYVRDQEGKVQQIFPNQIDITPVSDEPVRSGVVANFFKAMKERREMTYEERVNL